MFHSQAAGRIYVLAQASPGGKNNSISERPQSSSSDQKVFLDARRCVTTTIATFTKEGFVDRNAMSYYCH